MTLDLRARLAERDLDVELHLDAGTTTAVLGPNGAGKSTLVAILAGLVRPDEGSAVLAGRALFDTGRRLHVPPHRRDVALLAQDPLLFPHLSVLENVAFGPRSAGMGRRDARALARTRLAEVDAAALAHRRPAELSGGQAQRVALARALAPDPALLLLDEPMAALDVSVAPLMRRMLREALRDRTTILVTHDVLDAYTLADRVVVLHAGRIVEQGATREVLEHPRSRFTADLASLDLVTGLSTGTGLRDARGHELRVPGGASPPPGIEAAAAFRPAAVTVAPAGAGPVEVNQVRGVIVDVERRGDVLRVRADAIAADLTPAELAGLGAGIGDEVDFTVDPGAIALYPAR